MVSAAATPVLFSPLKYGQPLAVDSSTFPGWTGIVADGERHVLDFHEFLVVSKGKARITVDGDATVVEGPAVFFTPPRSVRRVELVDPMQLELVVWSNQALRHGGWIAALPRLRAGVIGIDTPELIASLHSVARGMQAELRTPRPDSGLMLDALLTQFLLTVNRSRADLDAQAPRLVERFERILEREFIRHHDVAYYAEWLGVTADYLSSVVRAHRGLSAKAFINRRVFNEAARLLTQTDRPVAVMSSTLGFDEPSHFTRFFTRAAGLSPTAFRRRAIDRGFRHADSGN